MDFKLPSAKTPESLYKLLPVHTFMIFIVIIVIGCSDNTTGSENDDEDNEDPTTAQINISNFTFNPSNLEIEQGTTVTWINQDNEIHTATSGSDREQDGVFNSGNIEPGEEYEYTFNEPGTYDYFCIPHVGMSGIVTVNAE
ncbi:MAG: cupredoxin family copper-binding protein [Balneolales bacterium]